MERRLMLIIVNVLVLTLMVLGCIKPATTPAPDAGQEQEEMGPESPEKPITLIVTFGPGGGVDIMSRIIAKHVQEFLGQPLVIKNVEGGGGEVGLVEALNAPPDGYTISNFGSAHVILAFMREAGYHPIDDVSPICLGVSDPKIFAVKADDERFIEEGSFIQYAKDNPDKLTIGDAGAGSSGHLLTDIMADALGIKVQPVHFGGSGELAPAVLGGHIDVLSCAYGVHINNVKEGNLRFVAVATEERLPDFPDVPTLKELGVDVVMASNRGYVAHKDVPEEIIEKLADAFEKALTKPECIEEMNNAGYPVNFLGVKEWTDLIKYEYDLYEKLLK